MELLSCLTWLCCTPTQKQSTFLQEQREGKKQTILAGTFGAAFVSASLGLNQELGPADSYRGPAFETHSDSSNNLRKKRLKRAIITQTMTKYRFIIHGHLNHTNTSLCINFQKPNTPSESESENVAAEFSTESAGNVSLTTM